MKEQNTKAKAENINYDTGTLLPHLHPNINKPHHTYPIPPSLVRTIQ